MKKQQNNLNEISSSGSFKNPICQDTFNSLPKIYGGLKHRIQSKLHLNEHIQKKSLAKLSRSKDRSPQSDSNKNLLKKSLKKDIVSLSHANVEKQRSSAKIIFKKVTNFSSKYHNLPLFRKEQKAARMNIKVDDIQIQHRVRFNTLNSMLPSLQTKRSPILKPSTLSELPDQKISKSVESVNPLFHLYKNKSPRSPSNFQFSIKEQILEESPNATIEKSNAPREIKQSMRYQRFNQSENQNKDGKKRIKTEPSQYKSYISEKVTGNETQFSRRLVQESNLKRAKSKIHLFRRQSTKFHVPTKDEYNMFISNYEPINSLFSLKALVKKQDFKIIPLEDSVYFGIFKGKKQGFGVLISEDSIFEGYFDQNRKVKGTEVTFDGTYQGAFNKEGKRSGKGKFEWNNGQVYEGDWEEGKKHGYGTWKSPEGDSYEGQWMNGRQQGNGVHKHKSSVYKGQFMNSLKHGKGIEHFINGDSYNGNYEKGRPHGEGRYEWADGSHYEGTFKKGLRQGMGVLEEHNGCSYKEKVSSREILSTVLGKKYYQMDKNSKESLRKVLESVKNIDSKKINQQFFLIKQSLFTLF